MKRSVVLAVVLVAVAVGFAACGGPGAPSVANLGTNTGAGKSSSTGSTTTTLPKGNPNELVDKWAACMRRHGDPNQADPTIDSGGVIDVTFPDGYYSAFSGPDGSLGGPCADYLAAASTALRGGRPLKLPSQAETLQFAACMRAHGIRDFPEPTDGGLTINVGESPDLNPNNPTFQRASKLCAEKTGVPALGGSPEPGMIKTRGGGPPCNQKPTAAADASRSGASQPTGRNRVKLAMFLEC
jgi:hypothetical protein